VLDTLPTWEIPLLLGEGRVRYGLRWADLADLADIASSEAGMVQRSPQALHKRFGPTVNRLARAAETMSRGADDDDFYTAAGLLA
jgi:hypothetical protein